MDNNGGLREAKEDVLAAKYFDVYNSYSLIPAFD